MIGKQDILAGVLMVGVGIASQGAIPLYENFGTLTDVPQIDAISFANYGTFSVSTVLPYDFQDTLNFTNMAEMSGSPGFRSG